MNKNVHEFRLAMVAHGLFPPENIEPGKMYRFPSNARQSDTAGWCKLFPDESGGIFGDFRCGLNTVWLAKDSTPPTFAQRQKRSAELKRAQADATIELNNRWARAADINSDLWAQAVGITTADPVVRYLSGRGILLNNWPSALRYHPSLDYWQEGRLFGRFPAMVAAVTNIDGKLVSIHRTYLTSDGRKANVGTVKKLVGCSARLAGCSIKLGQIDFSQRVPIIGVAEGIETALACMAASGIPTVSAVSVHGLERYHWSKGTHGLIVFGDNDGNQVGQQAAAALSHRALSDGLSVRVLIPPQVDTDWADVWASQGEGE